MNFAATLRSMIKKLALFTFTTIALFNSICLNAQDTLTLSPKDCEAIFLKENLELLAEKLNIPIAEAAVLQAGLWPNPTLTVDNVNLWATKKQLKASGQSLPGIGNSSFGRNTEVAVSVEQTIITAGKRRKLVNLEKVSVQKAGQAFEELLRNLKVELRNQLAQLQYLQQLKTTYQSQLRSLKQLTGSFQKQVQHGFAPQGELIRLKALELEIAKNINDIERDLNEAQKELKIMLHLPASTWLQIAPAKFLPANNIAAITSVAPLIEAAKNSRPDLKLAWLEEQHFNRLYEYEQAQRTPNVMLKAGYDRAGGFVNNFVGFGAAIELPFFNRNQGNIKIAKAGIEQAKILHARKETTIENEVALAFRNLITAVDFYNRIEPGYENTLDELLAAYTKNFSNRNISLLEYIDFLNAYIENKKIIFEAVKEVNHQAEELNFYVGRDVIN